MAAEIKSVGYSKLNDSLIKYYFHYFFHSAIVQQCSSTYYLNNLNSLVEKNGVEVVAASAL